MSKPELGMKHVGVHVWSPDANGILRLDEDKNGCFCSECINYRRRKKIQDQRGSKR